MAKEPSAFGLQDDVRTLPSNITKEFFEKWGKVSGRQIGDILEERKNANEHLENIENQLKGLNQFFQKNHGSVFGGGAGTSGRKTEKKESGGNAVFGNAPKNAAAEAVKAADSRRTALELGKNVEEMSNNIEEGQKKNQEIQERDLARKNAEYKKASVRGKIVEYGLRKISGVLSNCFNLLDRQVKSNIDFQKRNRISSEQRLKYDERIRSAVDELGLTTRFGLEEQNRVREIAVAENLNMNDENFSEIIKNLVAFQAISENSSDIQKKYLQTTKTMGAQSAKTLANMSSRLLMLGNRLSVSGADQEAIVSRVFDTGVINAITQNYNGDQEKALKELEKIGLASETMLSMGINRDAAEKITEMAMDVLKKPITELSEDTKQFVLMSGESPQAFKEMVSNGTLGANDIVQRILAKSSEFMSGQSGENKTLLMKSLGLDQDTMNNIMLLNKNKFGGKGGLGFAFGENMNRLVNDQDFQDLGNNVKNAVDAQMKNFPPGWGERITNFITNNKYFHGLEDILSSGFMKMTFEAGEIAASVFSIIWEMRKIRASITMGAGAAGPVGGGTGVLGGLKSGIKGGKGFGSVLKGAGKAAGVASILSACYAIHTGIQDLNEANSEANFEKREKIKRNALIKGLINFGVPVLGSVIGSFFGPGLGTVIGGAAGGIVANLINEKFFDEKMEKALPQYETGGRIAETGFAKLHAGELVLNKDQTEILDRNLGWICKFEELNKNTGIIPGGGIAKFADDINANTTNGYISLFGCMKNIADIVSPLKGVGYNNDVVSSLNDLYRSLISTLDHHYGKDYEFVKNAGNNGPSFKYEEYKDVIRKKTPWKYDEWVAKRLGLNKFWSDDINKWLKSNRYNDLMDRYDKITDASWWSKGKYGFESPWQSRIGSGYESFFDMLNDKAKTRYMTDAILNNFDMLKNLIDNEYKDGLVFDKEDILSESNSFREFRDKYNELVSSYKINLAKAVSVPLEYSWPEKLIWSKDTESNSSNVEQTSNKVLKGKINLAKGGLDNTTNIRALTVGMEGAKDTNALITERNKLNRITENRVVGDETKSLLDYRKAVWFGEGPFYADKDSQFGNNISWKHSANGKELKKMKGNGFIKRAEELFAGKNSPVQPFLDGTHYTLAFTDGYKDAKDSFREYKNGLELYPFGMALDYDLVRPDGETVKRNNSQYARLNDILKRRSNVHGLKFNLAPVQKRTAAGKDRLYRHVEYMESMAVNEIRKSDAVLEEIKNSLSNLSGNKELSVAVNEFRKKYDTVNSPEKPSRTAFSAKRATPAHKMG